MEADPLLLKILDCPGSHRYTWPVAHYDEMLRKDPGNVRALNNKACFLAYLGCMAESVWIFDGILARERDNPVALSNKAAVVQACGQDEAALDLLERILEKDPSDLAVRVRCINLLTSLGRYGEALRCSGEMPAPSGMARMLLGSLSKEFRTLRKIRAESGSVDMAAKRMEEARAGKNREEPAGLPALYLTLL